MPLDSLPGSLATPTRDDTRESYLRSVRLRNPGALTTENTQPWIDACVFADNVQAVYRDAVVANNGVTLKNASGSALDDRGAAFGVLGKRLGPIGGSGYVKVSASIGGTTILLGDEIKTVAGLRFQCNATALYNDGDPCPIIGIDTGPTTNIAAGTVMTWTNPRPGSGTQATVNAQGDGSGLTGGRTTEDDDTYRLRLIQLQSNPPASGNDAEYQATGYLTPGVAVQQIFTCPCIKDATSMGVVFTLRPSAAGATRIPNGAQITAVLAQLTGAMPADDGIFVGTLTAQPTDVVLRISWSYGSPTWVDTVPWPTYYAAAGQAIVVNTVTDSTHFVLKTFNSSYTSIVSPVAGQTIAFYDAPNKLFRRKKILTVTGTGPWTIVCDATNGASDTSYVPLAAQRACPWSDSMNNVPAAVVSYFDTLGPGEQIDPSLFFDPGQRQRRSPVSPQFYPNQVNNRMLTPVLGALSVGDAIVLEPTIPHTTTIGTPGVLSYLQVLNQLSLFPE